MSSSRKRNAPDDSLVLYTKRARVVSPPSSPREEVPQVSATATDSVAMNDEAVVDATLEPPVGSEGDDTGSGTDRAITLQDGATDSAEEVPFLIVVNSEHDLKTITIYISLRTAVVEHCIPSSLLTRLSSESFCPPICLFGANALGARMKKVTATRVTIRSKYETSDQLYVRYALKTHTDIEDAVLQQIRFSVRLPGNGCAPLSVGTATQLGLTRTEGRYHGHGIENLDSICCSGTKYLQQWVREVLSAPPPQYVAQNIRAACEYFANAQQAMLSVVPTTTLCAMTNAFSKGEQRNLVGYLKEARHLIDSVRTLLIDQRFAPLCALLHPITRYYCTADDERFSDVQNTSETLQTALQHIHHAFPSEEQGSSRREYSESSVIDKKYFYAKESGLFNNGFDEMDVHRETLDRLVGELEAEILAEEGCYLRYQTGTNEEPTRMVLVRGEQTVECSHGIIARQVLYERAAHMAAKRVAQLYQGVCTEVDLPALEFSWRWLVIFQALWQHVKDAKQRKWTVAHMISDATHMQLQAAWPYWMSQKSASAHDLDVSGVIVLTGQNKSGKSVLLRTTCAIALLANCGFAVPCRSAVVPWFDRIVLCMSSNDLPAENKSRYGVQADDASVLASCTGRRSLILLDELGDGTNAEEALDVVAGMLSFMNARGAKCILSTHARELLQRVHQPQDYVWKTMDVIPHGKSTGVPAYAVRDGVCEKSMALGTLCAAQVQDELLEHIAAYAGSEAVQNALSHAASTDSRLDNADVEGIYGVFIREIFCAETGAKDTQNFARSAFEASHGEMCAVRPGQTAPPRFAGVHCCYLRQNTETRAFYVGESDRVSERIQEHRDAHRDRSFIFYLVTVANRTCARIAESETVRALVRRGVHLDSEHDGCHRNGGK